MERKKIEVIEKGRMSDGEMGFVYGGASPGCSDNLCTPGQDKYSITQCLSKTSCDPHERSCGRGTSVWEVPSCSPYGCKGYVSGIAGDEGTDVGVAPDVPVAPPVAPVATIC